MNIQDIRLNVWYKTDFSNIAFNNIYYYITCIFEENENIFFCGFMKHNKGFINVDKILILHNEKLTLVKDDSELKREIKKWKAQRL